MEMGFHQWLQVPLSDCLRYPVTDSRNPELSDTSIGFRYFNPKYRRRHVTARGHPIPDLVQPIVSVLIELLHCLPIHTGPTLGTLDVPVGVPHQ